MNTNLSFTLAEIASWTSNDSEIVIPALQRGLVWNPNQVELLWDSILRGFPIGSFLLSDISEETGNGKYYLMDGQQRFNAISLGFNTIKDARAVLWIDVEPPKTQSTRSFWVKATTCPHPWGFKNDDECSRLNTEEKREALKTFGLKGNIYNNDISLLDTWPINSKSPIPLFCLLDAETNDKDVFLEQTLENYKKSRFVYKEVSEKGKEYIKEKLFFAFKTIKDYHVSCNHLSNEVMAAETNSDSNEQTTLEILFTRLNTGGTTISRDDLNYSAIKAYWPSIKETNDYLAQKYMSPSKMVMLAFRLALTKDEDNKLKNELSIKQIRNAAKNESERNTIENLYNQRLKCILEKIDEWLGINDISELKTPSLLRTIIAHNSTDIYLLLMYFADKDLQKKIDLTSEEIKSLAFCLHWFANDKRACVQEIFLRCKDGINITNIQMAISRLMHDCLLLHIYSVEEIKDFVRIETSEKWRLHQNLPAPAKEFFNRIFWYGNSQAKEILLYAQRQYLNTHFSNYDPARQDMWAEYNRPWDYDHIIAQDRILGKRGLFREFDKIWLNSIGNIAAISFEANRSKNSGLVFDEYQNPKNSDALMYDCGVEEIKKTNFTYDKSESNVFANVTYNRFLAIYKRVFDVIKITADNTILSNTLKRRKDLFLEITNRIPNSFVCFAASDSKDYKLTREQDWAREWIGVEVDIKGYCVCYEWDARENNNGKEIGIRKSPESIINNEKLETLSNLNIDGYEKHTNNEWWYYWRNSSSFTNIDEIVEEMNHLIKILENSI